MPEGRTHVNNIRAREKLGDIKQYFLYYKWAFIAVVLLSLCAFGYQLFNYTVSIDEENAWSYGSSIPLVANAFMSDGKFGQMILGLLTGTTIPIPFYNMALSLLFMVGLCVCIGYSFWQQGYRNRLFFVIASGFFVTSSMHMYILVFAFMAPAIMLCYCLNAISIALMNSWVYHGRFRLVEFLLAVVLCTITLGTYQSMAPSFLVLACIHVLPYFLKNAVVFKKFLSIFFKYLIVLGSGCILYFGFNWVLQHIIPQRGYLDSYVGWGKMGTLDVLRTVWDFYLKTQNGELIYGGKFAGISTLLLLAVVLYRVINERRFNLVNLVAFGIAVFPYCLNFVLGGSLQIRSMQGIPLMVMGIWLFILFSLPKRITVMAVASLVCVLGIGSQVMASNRLSFTAQNRYEHDKELANRIVQRVEEESGQPFGTKHLVFIGAYELVPNGVTIIPSETISASFFNWDDPMQQGRKLSFFGYLGKPYPPPSESMLVAALADSINMPAWPNAGSVVDYPEYTVIKLGENLSTEMFMKLAYTQNTLPALDALATEEQEGALASDIHQAYMIDAGNEAALALYGWAFDAFAEAPLQQLQVAIGERTFYSNGQLPSGYVAEAYNNPDLSCVAFNTVIPLSVIETGTHEIQLLGFTAEATSYLAGTGIQLVKSEDGSVQIIWPGND